VCGNLYEVRPEDKMAANSENGDIIVLSQTRALHMLSTCPTIEFYP
jgi:hypothetical protein